MFATLLSCDFEVTVVLVHAWWVKVKIQQSLLVQCYHESRLLFVSFLRLQLIHNNKDNKCILYKIDRFMGSWVDYLTKFQQIVKSVNPQQTSMCLCKIKLQYAILLLTYII